MCVRVRMYNVYHSRATLFVQWKNRKFSALLRAYKGMFHGSDNIFYIARFIMFHQKFTTIVISFNFDGANAMRFTLFYSFEQELLLY